MAVFRIEKTRDYTVMSNHHLRDKSLSLKVKGLLSLMLSLPEEWDYTTKGLARICKDGVDSICAGVRELEEHGYVIRQRVRNANITDDTVEWLQNNGVVVSYETRDELETAVNNPSTQMIGVLQTGNMIQTFIAGDELVVNKVIANTLPQVYENRATQLTITRTIIPVVTDNEGLKSLFIVITLVTAMFMGCTFNAMNIISEKEDGIEFINQVLPVSMTSYIIQKTLLGFIGGTVSTIITALICMRIQAAQVLSFLLIVLLSAYIYALIGLFIGYYANGLMVGIVYIKIVMILFLAPPIFFYLTVPSDSIVFRLSYFLPSSVTFYGVMDLINGQTKEIGSYALALLIHAVFWSVVYKLIRKTKKTNL